MSKINPTLTCMVCCTSFYEKDGDALLGAIGHHKKDGHNVWMVGEHE